MTNQKIRSVFIWGIGGILTFILFVFMSACTILFPLDRKRKIAHAQCFWWSDLVISLNPYWKIKVSGLENINKKTTYVIVANHQSLADVVVLYQTKAQFKWVAKESLFNVPIIGRNLKIAKHICLERGNLSSVKQIYREAAAWIRDGVSVLFFPEGTRSETSEMKEFQNGAFKLAIREKVPILPIYIEGTGNTIRKGSWIFNANVPCRLKVLPQIDTTTFGVADFTALRDLTKARLVEASQSKD